MRKKCYRIVTDDHSGFEVQVKKWYWPFWTQVPHFEEINTFSSIKEAKDWIDKGCPRIHKFKKSQVWIKEGCL